MVIEKLLGKIILAAVFLFSCQALCAQQAGYYVDYSDNKPRLVQRFVWDREEYALYYEVLIYADSGGYREYLKETTEDNFLLVSLPPGRYRYSVTPYDLLEIRGETSEWKEFEVLPAFQPALESFTPQAFYLDQRIERELHIYGANLLEESDIYLQSSTDFLYPDRVIIANNGSVTLFFDDMKLVPGDYDIHVRNPGGLNAQLGEFVIGYRKPMDFFLKLSWSPLIPIYGYMKEIMGSNVYFAGMTFSFETISSVRGNFNGGLELAASVNFLKSAVSLQTGNEDFQTGFLGAETEALLVSFDLNFALQRRFNRGRMAFTFRFGVGAVAMSGFRNYEQNDINDIIVQLNLGADYIVMLYKNFNIEAGVDFNNYISSISSGILKPRLGVVWQF